ncbi:MAG: DUF2225 domain-containing protein [Promethearchaeota archaeon]
MTTLYPIELQCAVCDKTFESSEIGSCGYASKRTDFRPNYWGFNPVYYFYHLCPHCGFCAPKSVFEMDFDKHKTEIKQKMDELGLLDNKILSMKLERAMICLQIANELGIVHVDDFTLANNWIEPYWWADDPGDIKKFGEIALRYFYSAFEKNQVPNDQKISTKYLMGEINRRIGNKEKAIELFDELLSLAGNNKELREIYSLTLQQKTNPKDILG